jgi:hypothetical protein
MTGNLNREWPQPESEIIAFVQANARRYADGKAGNTL